MNQQTQQINTQAKMQQVLAKCWSDESFKKKLLADPAATLKAEGVPPPAGLSVKVVENTDKVLYLTIPVRPPLSDDDLEMVSGGGAFNPLDFFVGQANNPLFQAPSFAGGGPLIGGIETHNFWAS